MAVSLEDVAHLARALLDAEQAEAQAEQALAKAQAHTTKLREETIPGVMQEMGLKSIALSTGQTVSLKDEVYASIPKDNKPDAFKWLDANGFGSLIKTEVSIEWGRGDMKKALTFYKRVRKTLPQANMDMTVHAQTLKAFIREQLAKAASVPLDLFGARSVLVAKITEKK